MKEGFESNEKPYFVLWTFGVVFLIWSAAQMFLLSWYGLPLSQSFLDSIVSGLVFTLSSFIITNALRFYQPNKEKYSYILIWVLLLTLLSTYLSMVLINWLFPVDFAYISFVKASLPLRFLAAFFLIGSTAIFNVLWNTQKHRNEFEKRKSDAEKLAREAELFNLRQQLQPHFLFNSLNSIVALIGSKPQQAKEMVFQLSDFLRGTLRNDNEQLIPLKDELEHLELYLEIEKIRFGHRLEVLVDVQKEAMDMTLPAMIIQPLLENAIKYGLYDTTDDISIQIQSEISAQFLELKIKNPYDPNSSPPKSGSGFGLRSVKRRLFLLYGRTDLLHTIAENGIFTALIKIPQNYDKGIINR